MDEVQVSALIAEGEGEGRVDFKRELSLGSARNKAEFVKDVISLANSTPTGGYLLIGVDDDKYIVGVDNIEEEQIQQIARTYIDQAVLLRCFLVSMATADFVSVGVIEVKPTFRPHKVARAIDRLNQGDVFVRHGSVVSKASPEEMESMFRAREGEIQLLREIQQYIRSAETHLKLGNWQSAIAAYSKAIEVNPTSELFVARGKVYKLQAEHSERPANIAWDDWEDNPMALRKKAHRDLSQALGLSPSRELETEARLGRVRVDIYSWDGKEEDLAWLKANTEGRKRGEVLYSEVEGWDALGEESVAQEAEHLLSQAIEAGYDGPDVYHLRAHINAELCNYGLALQDIDVAISKVERKDKNYTKFLCLRASILAAMGRFKEAYRILAKAKRNKSIRASGHYWSFRKCRDEDAILCRCALDYEFGGWPILWPINAIVQVLTLSKGRKVTSFKKRSDGVIEFESELGRFEEKYPGIHRTIREMVGEELWSPMKDTTDELKFSIPFPSIAEQVQE